MNIYYASECAVFYKTKDKFGELSNMCAGFGLNLPDRYWLSSEALYQALRYPDCPHIHTHINSASNSFLAKQFAYEYINHTRTDWNDVKIDVMEQCLRLKVSQHYDAIRSVLINTGNIPIVEKSKSDNFWGAISNNENILTGHNVLGTLWMILREEMLTDTFKFNHVFEL